MWSRIADFIREATRRVLGASRGYPSGQIGDWWWNTEVQGQVKAKKAAYTMLVENLDEEDTRRNRERFETTKKEVRLARTPIVCGLG